ncbi:MAG: ATP-binding cassette domain-containing protein [Candidatus Aminicenantes bacterium]|nr:ATP-binding cassette domain-containing protein [Candidatus Aminicenantes bacterium]
MHSNTHHTERAHPEKPLLQMKNIHKSFSGVKVLDGVCFDLKKGEIHVLAGENGAGKTTLVKILSGAHTDHSGDVYLDGALVRFVSPSHAAKYGISAIYQERSLVNSMSVRDNIFLGKEKTDLLGRMNFKQENDLARHVLQQLGLDIDISRPLSSYPLSVKQMIEIAKALVNESKIIIMDEPTSALNTMETSHLFEIINELKKNGHGIVFISHRLEEIYNIADRITVLRDGKYIGTSVPDRLSSKNLVKWMVGRELKEQFPSRTPFSKKKSSVILSVRDLSLNNKSISFDLYSGEILGIAGLQGSGKSLILHSLFGTFGKPDLGHMSLDHREHMVKSPAKSIQNGIALLTNDRKNNGLVFDMSVKENITLASLSKFLKWGWIQKKKEDFVVSRMFESFHIKAKSMEQTVSTLSGGNQQKVLLAKWLMTNPKVLFLDEPTIGIDVAAKHEIYKLMNQWRDQGLGQILITSELPELLALSDRILVLHRGRLSALYEQHEATQEKILRSAMGQCN